MKKYRGMLAGLISAAVLAAGVTLPYAAESTERKGSILNIYSSTAWLKTRVVQFIPSYEEIDSTHGRFTDEDGEEIEVIWTMISDNSVSYRNSVNEVIYDNPNLLPDDRIDLFVADASYLKQYMSADYDLAVPLEELGISEDSLSDQFAYTHAAASDENGVLRGVSYKANISIMVYNRAIAQEVFGTDDPETIQSRFSDIDAMKEAAQILRDYGYRLTATATDLYRVYDASRSQKWVQGKKITVDPVMEQWARDAREMVDAGMITAEDLYGNTWNQGLYADGGVFCYFVPITTLNSKMTTADGNSLCASGGWAAARGPAAFSWGDNCYIMAARGSDNLAADAMIMRIIACDQETAASMAYNDHVEVNSLSVISSLASSDSGVKSSLGGQNPYGILIENGQAVSAAVMGEYDDVCQEKFISCMSNYLKDRVTYEEALEQFYSAVTGRLSGLSK